jgi:hypothetical protein
VGGVPYFVDKYKLDADTYTYESLQAGNPQLYSPVLFKPEAVTSFELGYKGLLLRR